MPPRTPPYLVPQTAVIPLLAGVDLHTAEEVVDPPKLLNLRNATFAEPGIIKKDSGYVELGQLVQGGGMQAPRRRVLTDGKRQIVFSGRGMYERLATKPTPRHVEADAVYGVFASTGTESVSEVPTAANAVSTDTIDHAYNDASGYEVFVFNDRTDGKLHYAFRERSTHSVQFAQTLSVTSCVVARCFTVGSWLGFVYVDGASLKAVFNNTTTALTLSDTIISDAVSANQFDVVEGEAASNDIYIAYKTASAVKLIEYNLPLGAVQNSGTVTPSGDHTVYAVGRNPADNGLLVLWDDQSDGIKFSAFASDCTAGSTTVENGTPGHTAGVGEGGICDCGNGTDAYIFYTHGNGSDPDVLERRVVLWDGSATVSGRETLHSGSPPVTVKGGAIVHKPFLFGGNVYIGVAHSPGTTAAEETWCATLACDPDDVTTIVPVAWYLYQLFRYHTSNHKSASVHYDSAADEYRWMALEKINLGEKSDSGVDFDVSPSLQALRFYDGAPLTIGNVFCMASDTALVARGNLDRALRGVGFQYGPKIYSATSVSGSGGGLVASDVHEYVAIYELIDERGNVLRSHPSDPVSMTVGSGHTEADIVVRLPFFRGPIEPKVLLYRTEDAGTVHYRLSAVGTGQISGSAGVVTIRDDEADADITSRQILYTDGGALPNYPPPMGRFWTIHQDRVWNIDEHTGEIRYSKELVRGEGPAWHPLLTVDARTDRIEPKALVPTATGLWVIGKDRDSGRGAIGIIVGDGPNDQGVGASYQLQRLDGADAGTDNYRTVAVIPDGILFEDPRRGIHLLPASGGQPVPIGEPVEQLRANLSLVSADLFEDRREVRFVSDSDAILVYDYHLRQWSERIASHGSAHVDSCIWDGKHVLALASNAVHQHTEGQWDGSGLVIETAWIRLAQFSGLKRVWRLWLLGRYVDAHDLQVEVFYDFNDDDGNAELYELHEFAEDDLDTLETTGEVYELLLEPRRQQFQSFKLRVTDSRDAKVGTLGGGYALYALRIEYGVAGRGSKKPSYLRSA